MKSLAEKELKADLDSILTCAQSERIVISRRGKPCAVLVGIENYDTEDLDDSRVESRTGMRRVAHAKARRRQEERRELRDRLRARGRVANWVWK